MRFPVRSLTCGFMLILPFISGCGGKPPIHPVKGKVTLGGKAYPRLLVYFRPISGPITESNMAVGETDAEGKITFHSSAGDGLQSGEYKVSFTCMVNKKGAIVSSTTDKPDDISTETFLELVPQPYDDGTSADSTPVRFTVKAKEENNFVFDIPTSK